MCKKTIAFLLALALILSCVPTVTFAASGASANLNVADVYATPGSTVTVAVEIENNPGILGATLTVSWDDGLTLVEGTGGEAFAELTYQAPSRYTNGCNFVWYGSAVKQVKDGKVLLLTFQVEESAEEAKVCNVTVTYDSRDILDQSYNTVELTVKNGSVRIVTYKPGDVTGDDRINPLDLIKLSQYISDGGKTDPDGFNVTINTNAADVNDDDRINPLDLILISQYISDGGKTDPNGYNVELKPHTPRCEHEMQLTEAKEPTCTENGNTAYCYCVKCEKYFSDEAGTLEIEIEDSVVPAAHRLTHVEAIAATTEKEGCIEHWECTVCHEYFLDSAGVQELTRDEVFIPVIVRGESTVVYNVYGSDPYLEKVGVDNSKNASVFYSEDGLVLNDLIAPAGYIFKGWTTAEGTHIREIAPSTASRQVVLNATWEKVVYTVTFDSPDVPVHGKKITGETVTNYTEYTVDLGVTFENAEWYGYTFVGWSNDDGFLVKSIKPGTTGNITLHANWTANRNMATSYTEYGAPIIIEDAGNGQFLFVYNIGKIDNVPLNEIPGSYFHNMDVTKFNETLTISNAVSSEMVDGINKMISNATTQSSGWTLTSEWNDMYTSTETVGSLQEKSEERTNSQGQTVGGKYFVSNSEGGSTYVSNESGGSTFNSSKVTTDESMGINASYDKNTEKYCDAQLGIKTHLGGSATVGAEAGVAVPIPIGVASAGVNGSVTVDASVEGEAGIQNGRKDQSAFHIDGSYSQYTGTVDYDEEATYYNSTANSASNWNSSSGYEQSWQSSCESSVTQAIKEQLSKTSEHSISKAVGGGESTTASKQDTFTNSEEYNTTFTYGTADTTTSTKVEEKTFTVPGYYRFITAGTIHVYGVVGYDIATASYYTYCFNVLDDNTRQIWDYSKSDADFEDCNNGVVTFDIPFEVNEYVAGMVGKTDGLEISYDGVVTGFEPTDTFDGTVVIPQYDAKNNQDGTYSAVKVTSFNDAVFANVKDEVKVVVLPTYITEIPDNAFAGCTNLEAVIAYGVTKIGNNAFAGCVSLKKFYVDNAITSLGENAFEGVQEVAITAYDTGVADAAILCGAKRVSLNISYVTDRFADKVVNVPDSADYFALIGNGEYSNVRINSKANETLISNMTFIDNTGIPVEMTSATVTLARVKIQKAPGFAVVLKADNTRMNLLGSIDISSKSDHAMISKAITLSKADTSTTSELCLEGNYLVCGQITNDGMMKFVSGEVKYLAGEEYESMLTSSVVTFDPNGGNVLESSRTVMWGQAISNLPVPQKDYYDFTGWYTESGDLVEEGMIFTEVCDVTLYAHWELKPLSEWTLVSEVPGDAKIESQKWKYTLREYTTNAASSLSGWTKYDTQRTGWGTIQGPVYSDPSNGVRNVWSEQYVISSNYKTVYHYFRYSTGQYASGGSDKPTSKYGTNYYTYDFDYELIYTGSSGNNGVGYKDYYTAATANTVSGKFITVWKCDQFTTQEWVSDNYGTRWYYQEPVYTYYYYCDVQKEESYDPSGMPNVSNVTEWVRYREK